MDYSLCQALQFSNISEIESIVIYYDVNCMYSKSLPLRVKRSPFLNIMEHIKITPGIGLLHVAEHKPECTPRYAPTFIRSAGQVAGEIIESLWSGLNRCASATRTASDANRAETLDDHMNENNWRKLVNIGKLCIRYASKLFDPRKWKQCQSVISQLLRTCRSMKQTSMSDLRLLGRTT